MPHSLSLFQIAGLNGPTYESYFQEVDSKNTGHVEPLEAATFLKRSGLSDTLLSKVWEMADYERKGSLNKQGFFVALKLVALIQAGKEPLIGNLTMTVSAPKIKEIERPRAESSGKDSDWDKLFDSLHPENGKLSGMKVKQLLLESKLPMPTLVHIWDTSDVDKDGSLTRNEFHTAMRLVISAKESSPQQLVATSSATPVSMSTSSTPIYSYTPTSVGMVGVNNIESPQQLFQRLDTDGDGLVTGLDVKDLFFKTGLDAATLAQIWDQADTDRCGKLKFEQFNTAWSLIQKHSAAPPEVRQLEEVKARRAKLEQRCSEVSTELRVREAELQMAQREEHQLTTTVDQLQSQQKEALVKIREVEERDAKLTGSLAELEAKLKEEEESLNTARARLDNEQAGMKAVVQETSKLRKELTSLTREETAHVEALAKSKARLEQLQRELDTETRAAEVEESRLWGLRESLQKLQNGEDLADMIGDQHTLSQNSSLNKTDTSLDWFSSVPPVPASITTTPAAPFTTTSDNSGKDPFADFGSVFDNKTSFDSDPFASSTSTTDPFAALSSDNDPFAQLTGVFSSSSNSTTKQPPVVSTGFDDIDPFWSQPAAPSAASSVTKKDDFFMENPHDLTESEQLAWATAESQRLAEEARREEEDFKLALRLSQAEQ